MCRQEGSGRFAVNIAESFERVVCRDLSCHTKDRFTIKFQQRNRLRVVSNFGDGDCGAGEIHTRARVKFRGDATRGERWRSPPLASRLLEISRARVCISSAPKSPSPKLETTRSLTKESTPIPSDSRCS